MITYTLKKTLLVVVWKMGWEVRETGHRQMVYWEN